MSSLEEIRNERIKKLNILKEKGINPFPVSVNRDFLISEALGSFSKLSKKKKASYITGRIMAVRAHGGSIFFDIYDGSGKMQAYLKKDEIGNEKFNLFQDTADIGDFVEVKGLFFTTKKNEKSIKLKEWRMIAKSLRPLPEKWNGLQDIEERFRNRHLDILMNEEVRKRFFVRSKIITEIRNYLDKNGYIETETPILQHLAGGANAMPFITHHNALDIDLYLRIAPEIYLKKMLMGGFEKVYEIGRNFRNEGIDVMHNPEFTMLEFYEAYSDAKKQMIFVGKFIKSIIKNILKKNSIKFNGENIDIFKKFSSASYFDLIKRHALIIDIDKISRDDIAIKAKQFGIKVEDYESKEKIIDNIFKKIVRPKLIQPIFVTDYPVLSLPLAKKIENNEKLVDAFQLYIGGLELVKAFSELNDPINQQERFEQQDKEREAGDKEAQPSDRDFVEAMEYGMPPAGGVGIGIDRLVMLLTDTQNIREVIIFPTLRPK